MKKIIKRNLEIFYKEKILEFIRGVSNLIYYFKYVWSDRDHDYFYILKILKAKLKKNILFCEKFGSRGNNLERMKLCVKLIDRLLEDVYLNEMYEIVKSKDKEVLLDFIKKNEKLLKKEKIHFSEQDDYNILVTKVYLIYCYKTEKTYDLLFKVLQHNMLNWWI